MIFPCYFFIIYIRSTLGHLSRKPCFDPRAEIPVEYSYCATSHIIWLRKTACMHDIKLYTRCTYILLYFKTAFSNFHRILPPPVTIVFYCYYFFFYWNSDPWPRLSGTMSVSWLRHIVFVSRFLKNCLGKKNSELHIFFTRRYVILIYQRKIDYIYCALPFLMSYCWSVFDLQMLIFLCDLLQRRTYIMTYKLVVRCINWIRIVQFCNRLL